MPKRGFSHFRGLGDLVQCGHDTNFNVDVVPCRFTGFTHDQKYAKNHAKHHRIAIFTANVKNCKMEIEAFVGCCRLVAWPDNTTNDKWDKPKPKGVT